MKIDRIVSYTRCVFCYTIVTVDMRFFGEVYMKNEAVEYRTIEEVLERAKVAEGKPFKDYDIKNRLASSGNKGGLGQIIEEGLFGYDINSKSEADFFELGVELKVTPLKLDKKKRVVAKERLVLNIINYMEEYKFTFETSSFWKKNEKLLIMFYMWKENCERGDYKIIKSFLHTFSEEDLLIIVRDWETIVAKIRSGKAEEISEGDTMYLAACTMGANSNTTRKQPFSSIDAKQRAFSLKPSYITSYARSVLSNEIQVSLANADELREKSLEDILQDRFMPYYGLTTKEICLKLGTEAGIGKNEIPRLTSLMLGIKGTHLDEIEEFKKANIQFKTIRLEPDGLPKEHMSFEQINFQRLMEDDWEDSQFYEKFEYTKFLFVVFQYDEKLSVAKKKNREREPYLKKVILWNMPEKTVQTEIKDLWEATRKVLQDGVKFSPAKNGIGVSNNLPGAKDSEVCHIRPKGLNGNDKVQLPDGQWITKQCYWLNREYVAKIVE